MQQGYLHPFTGLERVLHGNAFHHDPPTPSISPSNLARVYDTGNHFLAIAEWRLDQNLWQPIKVLAP
ncbi:MAG: hypothetical protein E6I90_12490 [Chloroflexi bacterium]|nr:MAG: hypothetical protein E6I90_12490 [Chloroflexota bacterium]